MNKINVLFVCMGNLCRSPTAQAVFTHWVAEAGLAQQIVIDSAGTRVSHVGDPPDERAKRAAAKRGYDMRRIRTRAVQKTDFERFHYLLAMDDKNMSVLAQDCPDDHLTKLALLMSYATAGSGISVPDPYYGGAHGFERVLDMVEDAAQGLLRHIRKQHFL